MSLEDISEKYKISREDTTYLRQLYEIKNKGAKFINRKKTEFPLTQRQKDILYGSMMGDAKRQNSVSNASVGFNQGERQKDYLLWKFDEFRNVASENSLKGSSYIDKKSENESFRWSFYTYANTDVEICLAKFYDRGGKQVSNEIKVEY